MGGEPETVPPVAAQPVADDAPRELSHVDVPHPRSAPDNDSDEGADAQTGSGWLASTAIASAAVGWFSISRLVLNKSVVDAAGESVGGVLAMLVAVSVVGAVRRSRRRQAD